MTSTTDDAIRLETTCRGCGGFKQSGCIVCWGCFKYRKDGQDFKYYEGDLDQWLVAIGRREFTSTAKPPKEKA